MKRKLQSAFIVGSGILASLLTVLLIARQVDSATLSGFFLFQAVYFPVFSLMSQSKIIMMFRAGGKNGDSLLFDALIFGVVVLALAALGRQQFTWTEIVLYAAAIPLSYRGTTQIARFQYLSSRTSLLILPFLTGLSRVALCWGVLSAGMSAAAGFFAAACAWFVLPMLATFVLPTKPEAEPTEASTSLRAEWVPMFLFFAVSSIAFQWDRILLSQVPLPDLVSVSGVFMTWVLTPVSAVFATIYRADATQIFSAEAKETWNTRVYLRRIRLFVTIVVAYAALLSLFWTPLNALAFPFFSAPVTWMWLLVAAVVVDRCGHMVVFVQNDPKLYRQAVAIKSILIGVAGAWFWTNPDGGIALAYALYLGVAALYLGFGLALRAFNDK